MTTVNLFLIAAILGTSVSSEAQFSDRLYPVFELTDEMRKKIDVKDGSVEDWLEVFGEPTLTPLDFLTAPWASKYDPSSFDFRVWLAWHHGGNHLFVAAEMVDDFVHEHSTDRNFLSGQGVAQGDLFVWFFVDGDKSGGSLTIDNSLGLTHPMQQAQYYSAFPGTYSNDNNLKLTKVSSLTNWVHHPPYADGGGALVDSQPSFGVVEFYITPFDRLIWDDQENSIITDLFPGKTIGFALELIDVDENKMSLRPFTVFSDQVPNGIFGTLTFGLKGIFWEQKPPSRIQLLIVPHGPKSKPVCRNSQAIYQTT